MKAGLLINALPGNTVWRELLQILDHEDMHTCRDQLHHISLATPKFANDLSAQFRCLRGTIYPSHDIRDPLKNGRKLPDFSLPDPASRAISPDPGKSGSRNGSRCP